MYILVCTHTHTYMLCTIWLSTLLRDWGRSSDCWPASRDRLYRIITNLRTNSQFQFQSALLIACVSPSYYAKVKKCKTSHKEAEAMAPLIKCLRSKHEGLGLDSQDPQCWGGGDKKILRASKPAKLSELVSPRFRERSGLKEEDTWCNQSLVSTKKYMHTPAETKSPRLQTISMHVSKRTSIFLYVHSKY